MSPDVFAIIVTIVLAAAGVAGAALGWRRGRGMRAVLHGLGFSFIVAGLWVTGALELLLGGVRAVVSWIVAQRLTTQMWVGIGGVAAGAVLFAIGSRLTPVTRAEARQRRAAPSGAGTSAVGSRGRTPTLPGGSHPASPSGSGEDTAVLGDDEDEITQILRKHGIE